MFVYEKRVRAIICVFWKAEVFPNIIMAQSIPRMPILSGAFFGHSSSCRSLWWGFVTKGLCPVGMGHLSILLDAVTVVPFFNVSLKIYLFR